MKDLREQRKESFADTQQGYRSHARLVKSIQHSKQQQRVIAEEELLSLKESDRYDTAAKIVVSKKRSLEAALGYPDRKVCVLNFASATNAGGGVEKGLNAQEEAICRCSTLFPCIADAKIKEQFHHKHRTALRNGELNALYNDDCIYTPEVTVFKTDTDLPVWMSEENWYQVDVISCAAPNLRSKPSNAMNPDSGKQVWIEPEALWRLHQKRIRRVLEIARFYQAEIVILGAFGCGVFQNPPELVADAMAEVVGEYEKDFEGIEFAVYCNSQDRKNYEVFRQRLERYPVKQTMETI